MDVSKLRKLSDTQGQMPPGAPAPLQPVPSAGPEASGHPDKQLDYSYPPQPGIGVDIWISTIIGLLLLVMGKSFGGYALARLAHQPYHTNISWVDGPKSGTEVGYFELQGDTAWSEMGMFCFGLVLLFEATTKAASFFVPGPIAKGLLGLAVLLTLFTIGLNLYVCFRLFKLDIIPVISGLAVAVGGWVIYEEWRAFQTLSARLAYQKHATRAQV